MSLRKPITLGLSTILLTACLPSAPPPPPSPRSATEIAASSAKVWDAVVDIFAERNIPIKNMDRASGFISTDPLGIASEKNALAWADCGTSQGIPVIAGQATYNVLVRGDSARSTARATVRWTAAHGGTYLSDVIECTSKGVWESQLEAAIKARAEGATASAGSSTPP